MFLNYRKSGLFCVVSLLCLCSVSAIKAASSEFYLQQIASNTLGTKNNTTTIQQLTTQIQTTTNSILEKVNDLPHTLKKLLEFLHAMLDKDDSDTTDKMVKNFEELGNRLNENLTGQSSAQPTLNKALLKDVTKDNLPTANDLVYSSIFGVNFFQGDDPRKQTDSKFDPKVIPLNYIKNASGFNIHHTLPGSGWSGSKDDQQRYAGFYNTVISVESFNGYVLSNQYVDGPQFNDLQKKLISKATDPDWFPTVGSEKIGYVLRQLLIYQSQIFVMLTQLVQTQKQMVTAQAMTNALIVANAMNTESLMLAKAQGVRKVT